MLLADQLGFTARHHQLNLQKNGKPFDLQIGSVGDYSLLYDLFVKEEYARAGSLDSVSTVLDLGSNIGLSAIYFRHLFPEATIICYEPDRSNFRNLSVNMEGLDDITAHNMAAGSVDGELEFFENGRRGVSSSFQKRSTHQRCTRIPTLSFDSILAKHHHRKIDLLKFDIEGAEYELFRSARNLQNIKTFIGELHTDLIGCSVEEFKRLFSGYEVRTEELGKHRLLFFARRRNGAG